MTILSPIVGGHLTFEKVTFSPSQTGHKELLGIHPWNEINCIPAIWIPNHPVQNLCPETWKPTSAARYQISQKNGSNYTAVWWWFQLNWMFHIRKSNEIIYIYNTLNFRGKNTFETSRLMQAFSHLKGVQASMIASQNSTEIWENINGTNPPHTTRCQALSTAGADTAFVNICGTKRASLP